MPRISLFPTVKTAALYLVPIKSYSKNTHTPSFLKWVITFLYQLFDNFTQKFEASS
jgi:hypothetical protein